MNRLIQGHSAITPETLQKAWGSNQGTNEDGSQSDCHLNVGNFHNQTTRNSGPEVGHDMVTVVHEEVTYCSPITSSLKQKTNHCTSQLQCRSEDTPATIKADQILLTLHQLAKNNDSANFQISFNRLSKLPKSLTTTMPTFDGTSENFELFEDLYQTKPQSSHSVEWKCPNQILPLFMRGDALQTLKNING